MYKQFYPALYALCRNFFEERHEILSAVNNGMLRVYKNIDQFDSSKGSLFSWIYTIVRNAALSMLRERKTETKLVYREELDTSASIQPIFKGEMSESFYLLYQLPPTTRAVCSLFYMEGFSIKDISVALDCKEGTVKWHLNEGRTRLKNIVSQNSKKSV